MTRSDEIYQEIGRKLLADRSTDRAKGGTASLVFSIDQSKNTELRGYRFSNANWFAFLPEDSVDELQSLFMKLREEIADGTTGLWASALFRIDMNSFDFACDFDYDNPDRWVVSPSNMDEMIDEIRSAAPTG